MALILKPKLLIADEPTSGLDVTTQKQILMLIRELQDQQKTAVMFITHDFGVVAEIADRIVVMNKGRVVEVGEREAILARPRDDYTRMLVSAGPSLVPHGRAAPVGENMLTVRNLGKVYRENGVGAATDVNLTIARGEVVGIVGESGYGKSTVARCIVRLVDPSTGTIQIDGSDIASLSRRALRPLRQRFQIVFQDPYRSLNPRRCVGADSAIYRGPETRSGIAVAAGAEPAATSSLCRCHQSVSFLSMDRRDAQYSARRSTFQNRTRRRCRRLPRVRSSGSHPSPRRPRCRGKPCPGFERSGCSHQPVPLAHAGRGLAPPTPAFAYSRHADGPELPRALRPRRHAPCSSPRFDRRSPRPRRNRA